MEKFIIFLVVVLLIGAAYYFTIKNKSASTAVQPGSSNTSGSGNATLSNSIITPLSSHTLLINKGDNVYINKDYSPDDVYVYTYPKADGLYLIGNTRHSWWGSQPIGKFVEMAGSDWAKINVSGFQIFTYDAGKGQFSTATSKISQDVFVPIKEISNKPY